VIVVSGQRKPLCRVQRIDEHCRRFFLEPELTFHRRYEALRAVFIEGHPLAEVAQQYGYKPTSLNAMISTFRTQCRHGRIPPFSSSTAVADHRANRTAMSGMALTNPQSLISDS
jgi:hypothetical protein